MRLSQIIFKMWNVISNKIYPQSISTINAPIVQLIIHFAAKYFTVFFYIQRYRKTELARLSITNVTFWVNEIYLIFRLHNFS